jgi:serine/threonine protein kinase
MEQSYKIGDFIEDRYSVIDKLQGGMGTVYVAVDIALDQTVAIKTIISPVDHFKAKQMQTYDSFFKDTSSKDDWLRSFLTEARTWIQLERHPHIVQAKSTFLVQDNPFLVVEYVDGGDLSRVIRKRLDVLQVIALSLQFCAGAEYAYRKLGLIHRDIKSANLLLTKSGVLKITDFGLSLTSNEMKLKGTIGGTPLYMPPEQWMSADAVTKQSDIYSFGVVMYEMLTGGGLPFIAPSLKELQRKHAESPPPDPRTINSDIPKELSAIVLKCLEKNPTYRFHQYEELAEQLKKVYQKLAGAAYINNLEEEAVETDSPAELLNRGDSLFTIGRYSEAIQYYDQLLEIDSQSAKFWQRKAETLLRLNKYPEAEIYFNKALAIEPSNLEAIKGMIRCLIQMNRKEEALKLCSPTLALNQNDKELLRLKRELVAETLRFQRRDLSEIPGQAVDSTIIEAVESPTQITTFIEGGNSAKEESFPSVIDTSEPNTFPSIIDYESDK